MNDLVMEDTRRSNFAAPRHCSHATGFLESPANCHTRILSSAVLLASTSTTKWPGRTGVLLRDPGFASIAEPRLQVLDYLVVDEQVMDDRVGDVALFSLRATRLPAL